MTRWRIIKYLVVLHNSLYGLGDKATLEMAVKKITTAGGTVFHAPHCALAKRALGDRPPAVRVED